MIQTELKHYGVSSIEGKKKHSKRIPLEKINEQKSSEHDRPQIPLTP